MLRRAQYCHGQSSVCLSVTVRYCDHDYYRWYRGLVYCRQLLVVWLSGKALVAINEVTLRQAQLILGWVTVCGQVHHLGM